MACIFKVSNNAFGNWNDQVSGAVPGAQGNGRRWTVADLDAGVKQALGSFTPSDVSQAECDALIAFYAATGGDSWTNGAAGSGADAWMNSRAVGDWYGVTVAGGTVTALSLPTNNLIGAGSSLAACTALLTVNLSGNTGLTEAAINTILDDLDDNGLSSGTVNLGTTVAPGDAGLADAVSLVGKSWTVTLVADATQAVSSCRIATRDAEAMFFDESVSFAAYAGTDGGSTPYLLEFISGGYKAFAYAGAVGGGESLGSEIITAWTSVVAGYNNWLSFAGGSPPNITSAECNSPPSVCKTAPASLSQQSIHKAVYTVSIISGSNIQPGVGASGWFPYYLFGSYAANGVPTQWYFTPNHTFQDSFGFKANSNINFSAICSCKKLTGIPATGLHMHSTLNGTDRKMAYKHASFNLNTITSIKIYAT
jgi:hypothetical protein